MMMETITLKPKNKKQLQAIKSIADVLNIIYEEKEKSPYKPEFVAKIKKSEKNFEQGKFKIIKTEDLWK